jgi:hypothetical protein
MYNLSDTPITFETFDKDYPYPVLKGTVPPQLLHHLIDIVLLNTTRNLNIKTNDEIYNFTFEEIQSDDPRTGSDTEDVDHRIYTTLQEGATLDELELQNQNAWLMLQAKQDEVARAGDEAILIEMAQQREKDYLEMVENFTVEEQARKQFLEEEEYRLDMLRVHTITEIATDITKIESALRSEVGKNADVRRQIGAMVDASDEVAMLVIGIDPSLWDTSFEITTALAGRAHIPEVAHGLVDILPDDSNLKNLIIRFGWAS